MTDDDVWNTMDATTNVFPTIDGQPTGMEAIQEENDGQSEGELSVINKRKDTETSRANLTVNRSNRKLAPMDMTGMSGIAHERSQQGLDGEDNDDDLASHNSHTRSNNSGMPKPVIDYNIEKINPYKRFINIDDLIGHLKNGKELFNKICQVLLRHNSSIRYWYRIYSKRDIGNIEDFESGYFMRLHNFWLFIKDNRLANGKLSVVTFNKIFSNGCKNQYELEFNKRYVKRLVGEACKLNIDEQDPDDSADENEKVDKPTIENEIELLYENHEIDNKSMSEIHNPNKPM